MKPTLAILIGAPLEREEASFLRTLHADLAGADALVLANFIVDRRQIDYLVVTAAGATIVELKSFAGPIFGGENGDWQFLNAAGRRVSYDGNPYEQALQQKYALSDAMKRYQQANPAVPRPQKKGFYAEFSAFVCIYPEVHPESKVIKGDYRVRVASYSDVLAELRRGPDAARPSNWSLAVWRQFAETELGLKPVTLEEATDQRFSAASAALGAYRATVEASLRTGLGPLIGRSDNADYGQGLIENALQRHNVLLVGPSGSAKTFHLHHVALALCAAGAEFPVFVEARRYRGGDFWNVLRQGTAPFFAGDPRALLESARLCGVLPVLLIDALNECDTVHLPELLRGAQAFVVQFGARVVLTAQQKLELPGALKAVTRTLPLPDPGTKRLIYAYHAGVSPSADLDVFCQGFTNAYDLTIAGRSHKSGGAPDSRSALYDRYVRESLPKDAAIASALLRRVAGQMAEKISMICTRDEFERTAEQFISEHKGSLSLLDDLAHCRLIRLGHGFMTFEHELLFDYFKAEDLRRRVKSNDELAQELARPRYGDLLEFVIPRLTERSDVARLLATSRDATLLSRVCEGKCGALASSVLLEQCEGLMDAATQDLSNVSMAIATVQDDKGRRHLADVAVRGNRDWAPYDALLCSVIALNQNHPRLRDRFLDLLDVTTWSLRNAAQAAAELDRIKPARVWEETVRVYGGGIQHGVLRLPCTAILSGLRSALMYPRHYPSGLPIRGDLLQRVAKGAGNDLALLALLHDHYREAFDSADIAANLALVRKGWDTAVYTLRLEALELLQSMSHAIRQTCPEQFPRVREMLTAFKTRNVLENTVWLETLAAYDGLEQEITAEAALAEMQALIAPNAEADPHVIEAAKLSSMTPVQFLADRAQGTLGRIFEDVFQGAYMEGYYLLSDDEKHQILCLAGAAPTGFLTDWILGELLRYDGPNALAVYQRCAAGIDATNPFRQEAVACFTMGVEGCARWSDMPPKYSQGDNPEHRAWQLVGEILFWRARGARSAEGEQRIEELWQHFTGPVLLAAGDVLFQLRQSGWRLRDHDRPATDLVNAFPTAARYIIQACLKHPDSLPSIFPAFPGSHRDAIRFLITTLGELPDPSSIPILQELSDDPDFGADAVRAVEAIQRAALSQRNTELS
jgi:hypothetical protein